MDFNRFIKSSQKTVTPCILLAFLVCLALPAHSQSSRNSALKAQIKLLSGKEITLSGAIAVRGRFLTPEFSITSLRIRAISEFAPLTSGNLSLILRDTDQRFEVTPDKSAIISGTGEWGKERVPFYNIASLKFQHASKDKPPGFQANNKGKNIRRRFSKNTPVNRLNKSRVEKKVDSQAYQRQDACAVVARVMAAKKRAFR